MAAVEDHQGEDCGCHCARIVHLSIRAMKPGTYILIGLGLAVAILLGFLVGQRCPRNGGGETPTPKVDTLVIHDTTMSYRPIYVDRVKLDSVLVPVLDTMMIHDTTFVYLEREKVTWRDSLCEVYASGIMTSVDSVRHFQEYKCITIETQVPIKVKSHWGLGVNAGYGVGKGGLTPYVGVGISYNILSW